MTELTILEDNDEEYQLPPYGTVGRILLDVKRVYFHGDEKPTLWTSDFEYEIVDYDIDTSVFWLFESGTFEYCVFNDLNFPENGRYLIPNVVGHYWRGDGWTTDDDVTWEYGTPYKTDLEDLGEAI